MIEKENIIHGFHGENRWLSNFAYAQVWYQGVRFNCVESAFQAAKFDHLTPAEAAEAIGTEKMASCQLSPDDDKLIYHYFSKLKPGDAKHEGSRIRRLRPDWESVKFDIMRELIASKFRYNPQLRNQLIATGDAKLIEENYWHDNTWGVCTCPRCRNTAGRNMLGAILMETRNAYR